jgi:hypothetical protein
MRNIHGPTKDEVTVEWRRVHNEELRDVYSLQNIIRVIESIGIKKNRPSDPGVDVRVILKWILNKEDGMDYAWLRIGTSG